MISTSPDGNRGNTDQIADAGKTTHYSGVSGASALEKRDFKKRQ
jgi:hypothetical protein